jgi:AraC-like DNA-binding protein
MKVLFDRDKPSVAASYLQLLEEIAAEHGVQRAELLTGLPIAPDLLDRPGARISPVQWAMAIMRTMDLCQAPGLGYECGLRMRPTINGFLGYATMSCESVRAAVDVVARYFESRQRDFAMRVSIDGDWAAIEVRAKHPVPVLRSFFIEHIIVGIARGLTAILGMDIGALDGMELWFDWREPGYHAAYSERLPRIRFSQPANLLRLPARVLKLKPVLADAQASRQAIEMCERDLAQLGGADDSIVLRVCAQLVLTPGTGYPSQEALAARFHMATRTLSHKLRQDGTSYQKLLDETRRRDACELIEHSPLPLADVAAQLGYTNPANFTRAFRKWTGESPSEYRAKQSQSAEAWSKASATP